MESCKEKHVLIVAFDCAGVSHSHVCFCIQARQQTNVMISHASICFQVRFRLPSIPQRSRTLVLSMPYYIPCLMQA